MNELHLYGTVGESFWGEQCFNDADVAAQLAEMDSGDLTVYINSGGGNVWQGLGIYNQLDSYPGKVTMVVQGIAASIASVIAMAGDDIVMGDGSMIMVHDPAQMFTEGRGTEAEHRRVADGLGKAARNMVGVYAKATGRDADEIRALMLAETYLTADEAIEHGFATSMADNSETEMEPAAFDYGIYARAPQSLLTVGRELTPQVSEQAMVAMMAGHPAQKRSKTMPKTTKVTAATTADTTAQDDDDLTAATAADMDEEAVDEDEDMTAANDDEGVDAADDADDAGDEEPVATAHQLMTMAASFGLSAAQAQHMIAANMTPTAASNYIANQTQGDSPMTTTARRGPGLATIQRDERETMRAGMTDAIVAQLSRQRDVQGPARQFMTMSLVEMAAQAANYSGPLRSATDRIAAFEAAAHSTSDFPAIFENALNKRLLASYEAQQPTFMSIAERLDFLDFREVPLIRPGDFPLLKKVNENGELKVGTFGESKETAILTSYGIVVHISRQMMINDELGAIDRVLSNYGQRVAQFEDRTFYTFALVAKLSNNKAVFHVDHNNLAATGGAISVDTVDAGMQAVSEQKSIDGDVLNAIPTIILTGSKQALAAKRLIAEVTPSTADEVNPFSGDFSHIQTPRIQGNEWYLLCAPGVGGGSQWVYGYLDGAEGPRVRTEEPFGRQGMSMSVELDFGVGASDFRFGYKNPGQ